MEAGNGSLDGKLWIGRHSADGDTLVLDSLRSAPGSTNLSFFSLTQLRPRVFPRSVAEKQITEIVDPAERAQAEERYHAWPALKAERDQGLAQASADAIERQKELSIERHKLFLEHRELPYQGVQDSSSEGVKASAKRRRSSCHTCGIRLDDFVGMRCVGCGVILCSCGACGCAAAPREA